MRIVASGMLFVAKSFHGIGLAGEFYKKLMADYQLAIVFGYWGKKQSIHFIFSTYKSELYLIISKFS